MLITVTNVETGCLFELCAWTSLLIAHVIISEVVFAEVMFNHRLTVYHQD